ncbi:MAG: cell division protein FtsQ/DivIB [Paraperlucidibaca sp.]
MSAARRPIGAVPRPKSKPMREPMLANGRWRALLSWRPSVQLSAGLGQKLMLLISVIALVVVVMAVSVIWRDWQLNTPIRAVTISGELHQLERKDLQVALERQVRGTFFTVDLDALQRTAKRYPWVAEVQVSRHWPDSVQLSIREKHAVARWQPSGLVSEDGSIFRPRSATGVSDLPLLSGPRTQSQFVLKRYQEMAAVLAKVGLRVQALTLTDRMSWELTLNDGVNVLVDGQDTLAKLERFTVLYERQLAGEITSIARVDLRYRNGVAIGWRQAG